MKFHRFEGEGRVLICVPSTRAHHFSGPHGKAKKAIFNELIKKKTVLEEDRREHLAGLKGQERQEIARRFAEQIKSVKREIDELAPLSMGMTEKEVFTPNTLFWVEPMRLQRDRSNPTVWDKSVPRSERRRCMRTIAHIRIGSGEKSKPIFLTCSIVMHRPLPLNCRILSAAVNRRRFGSKFAWTVEFIVLFANQPHTESTGSVAAVDLGWAKDSLPNADGRIRVAGVLTRDRNGDRVFREIALSSRYTAAHMKFHELQSIRDQHTNECFARLEATGTLSDGSEDVQEVLQKAIASFKAQTSGHPPVRGLRRAVWIIRSGSAASEQVSTILQSWYERYMHLNNWLVNGRANLRAFRKDFFRRIAYKLAHENDVLLLDPDDFAEMARTPQTEEGTKRISGGVRVLSSPAELRAALQEAFADAGKTILYTVHAQGTSKTCSRCGHVHEVRVSRTFMCPACSLSMDREENAATNVLALFDQKPGSFSTKLRIAKNLQLKKEEELKQEYGAARAVSSS